MTMRIGMLECGTTPDEMLESHGSNLEDFKRLFSSVDPDLIYEDFRVYEGEIPTDPQVCDAYVITGSADGVNDRLDWMLALQDFLRKASDQSKPLLGICFGHQLLADTFGGMVVKSDKGWGIGLHDYEIHHKQNWMSEKDLYPDRSAFSIFATHQDQVITPPPGATVLAGNDFCPNAMLQINNHILSMQAHPEMSHSFGRALLELRRDKIGPDHVEKALGTLGDESDRSVVARWLVNFMRGTRIS